MRPPQASAHQWIAGSPGVAIASVPLITAGPPTQSTADSFSFLEVLMIFYGRPPLARAPCGSQVMSPLLADDGPPAEGPPMVDL
mmetsp:Transcript_7913/g.11182  ORF Transcript_7913/g.11182 Transcript_7913/m.11182 type:complete len:84 (-) Transcript_7913:101-352(-)